MKYVAMDFETGNGYYISACSVGLTYYEDDRRIRSETFLIRPPDSVGKFHWYNVKIHGIKRSQVKHAPTFDQVWDQIRDEIEGSVVVCHNAVFDTEVLCRCLEFYHLPLPRCRYICTVKVSQKVWPELENHKLNTVAEALGIPLNHHEAGSDAFACGEILQCALRKTGCADADALAEALQMRLGVISPEGKCSCSTAKEISNAQKHRVERHRHRPAGINSPNREEEKEQ